MLSLSEPAKVITFDCYGTLVQWHLALRAGVRNVLLESAGIDAVGDERVDDIVDALRASSMQDQQTPPYCDYKTILRSSLAGVMSTRGHRLRADDGETLLASLRDIPPHPDVRTALGRLRTRYKLGIISNTDDDLIACTVESIGIPIDFVVTAQQARAYKPDHQLFRHAHRVMGVTRDETIHVGMGQVTDLKVCQELGIRAVWINRIAEPLDPKWTPMAVLPELSGLPALLGAA